MQHQAHSKYSILLPGKFHGQRKLEGSSSWGHEELDTTEHYNSNSGNSGFCCSVAQLCPTLCDPWTAAHQASLSFTISQSLLKLMSIELVMLSIRQLITGLLV